MIYLDNAATTFPKPEAVYAAMDGYARTSAVNAGRGSYRAARAAGEMIRETRERLISLVDAREQACVVLAPSVTIAINQIILGLEWTEKSVAYVPYTDIKQALARGVVSVEGEDYPMRTDAEPQMTVISEETSPRVLLAGKLNIGDVVYEVPVIIDLAAGCYAGQVVTEDLHPISLLMQ